jgi:hypothetical protein
MKQKKFLALGMATVMAFSSTMMVLADDPTTAADVTDATNAENLTIGGSGQMEGYVDKDKFIVTLPTTKTVNFKLDPQGLIKAAQSTAKLDGKALEDADASKILFTDPSDTTTDYTKLTSKSSDITVVNKSSFDVDVTVNAKLTGLTSAAENTAPYAIKVVDSIGENDTDTEIAMTLTPTPGTITGTTATPGDSGTVTNLTSSDAGVTVTEKVDAAPAEAFKTTYDSNGYDYVLDSSKTASTAFSTITFNLAGTVNTNADWTNFNKSSNPMSVTITYSVKKHVNSYTSTTSVSTSSLSIKLDNMPETTDFDSITVVNLKGETISWTSGSQYKYDSSSKTITITSKTPVTNNAGGTMTIKYKDGHTDSISIASN